MMRVMRSLTDEQDRPRTRPARGQRGTGPGEVPSFVPNHVDERDSGSVESASGDDERHRTEVRPGSTSMRDGREPHGFVAVGPGRPAPVLLGSRAALFGMNPLPVQGARIHRPQLRGDTLSRSRLNGWLDEAATGRLVLIVAEAGFGKTTLLADWSRHTERSTAWYRLEPDDRDWLTFIRHLVGSGREIDPAFAPETDSLLAQLGPGGPSQAELVDALAREYAAFGATRPHGLSLIFDDYHVVDDCEDTQPIARALVERTGPGFSIVLATRSTPKLALGRIRARGALSRLDGDDLYFDVPETDQLFRDAYHQPLDADVVADLVARTEGWAALLSLVRTNLEESKTSNARDLVGHLSGARGHLYEYLAEEVVNSLPGELKAFLTRVSILDRVDLKAALLLDDRPSQSVLASIHDAEELGLLIRHESEAAPRFHPLVQEFLLTRLSAEVGVEHVSAMHRRVAERLRTVDWRIAAAHYRAAGDGDEAGRVIDAWVARILASGRFGEVSGFLDGSAGSEERAEALTLRSRVAMSRGDVDKAVALADAAVLGASPTFAGTALLNLANVMSVFGFSDDAVGFARQALAGELTPAQRYVAQASVWMWESAHEGDLPAIAEKLRFLAARQSREGLSRYAWISRINMSHVLLWAGDRQDALRVASALGRADATDGEPGLEQVSAIAARASATAYLGQLDEAQRLLDEAAALGSPASRNEALFELARLLMDLGDLEAAESAFRRISPAVPGGSLVGVWALVAGGLALRRGDLAGASDALRRLAATPCADVAGALRAQLLRTRVEVLADSSDALAEARELGRIASAQRSRPGRVLADVLAQIAGTGPLGSTVTQLAPEETVYLSMIAEELGVNLHRCEAEAKQILERECAARPARWRTALRAAALLAGPAKNEALRLLVVIGDQTDLGLLRSLSSSNRFAKSCASALARRLAPPVLVADLGAVAIKIGGRALDRPIRRRVLSLLCFLISRQNMVATRDEALEALWPDLAPEAGMNSLHQTIYFLRRVFEPTFKEGLSADYVLFDGEIVSLNPDYLDSSSRRCWRLIAEGRRLGRDVADDLAAAYTGRFAADFTYEEWAADYRDHLHAAVLGIVEASIAQALSQHRPDRAIGLAQGVLVLDPGADKIELALLRAYKAGNHHAAAAEQYAHYASYVRGQLGIEPPSLADV